VPSVSLSEARDHPFDHPDDPTRSVWIHLDRRGIQREQARSDWSRPVRRRAPGYGSGGWGFESLAARQTPSSEPIRQEKLVGADLAVAVLTCVEGQVLRRNHRIRSGPPTWSALFGRVGTHTELEDGAATGGAAQRIRITSGPGARMYHVTLRAGIATRALPAPLDTGPERWWS
jgi:hypothetical protein